MRTLLLICQVYHPDTTSTSQLFQLLVQRLVERGWNVRVLCGFPTQNRHGHLPRNEFCNQVTIHRCGLRVPLKNNFFYRSLSYISFCTGVFFKLLFSPRQCVWLGLTNPPFNVHVMAMASLIRRHRFYYFIQDLHPEGLLALNNWSQRNPIVRLWVFFNHIAYSKATTLFVLGRDMIPLLERNYRLPLSRIAYLPHWSPVEPRYPIPFKDSHFSGEWELTGKFIIQYAGNMGLWHDISSLVQTAHAVQHENDIQFVFIGDGIRKAAAMKLAAKLGVTNILWKDFLPLDDLEESLAACHVSLISLRQELEGIAVPCKLYGILATGRAVVAQVPADSEIALTVIENRCGVVVEPGNTHQLTRALLHLKNNPDDVEAMGQRAFLAYQSKYTASSAADSLEQFLVQ